MGQFILTGPSTAEKPSKASNLHSGTDRIAPSICVLCLFMKPAVSWKSLFDGQVQIAGVPPSFLLALVSHGPAYRMDDGVYMVPLGVPERLISRNGRFPIHEHRKN